MSRVPTIRPVYNWLCVSTALVNLLGCASDIPPSNGQIKPPETGSQICPANEYQSLLWQPRSFLEDVVLPKRTRVIEPNSAVTADYLPSRLNIFVGKLGRIERIYCG